MQSLINKSYAYQGPWIILKLDLSMLTNIKITNTEILEN